MQFASTGGIFLRLDSSGNLNVYNTAGTSVAKFVGTSFSQKGNLVTAALGSTITTTSASFVSTGLGLTLTPQISGRVMAAAMCPTSNNGIAGQNTLYIYYNLNSIPTAGTSVGTDNPFGNGAAMTFTSGAANEIGTVSTTMGSAATFTNGTALFIYIAWKVSAGTGTFYATDSTLQGILNCWEY